MPGRDIGQRLPGPENEEFRLSDYIGRGAFGEVYRAVGETTGTIVAVKILSTSGEFEGPQAEHSIMNEAKLAAEISHPNVVSVLHFASDPQVGPYLMMEYVSGGTLRELLDSQSQAEQLLDLARATTIMLEIAQGVRAVNERLVHRDIKPDNILISGDRFKVADFGISKLVAERTRTRTFKGVGPITHMAPEAWQLENNTTKLDVYSAGLVFYEILTLRNPLEGVAKGANDFDAWRQAHLYHPVPDVRTLRDDVPLSVSQLLSRMVSKRPQDRPDWNEIIEVVASWPEQQDDGSPIQQIIERAVARREDLERERLEAERLQGQSEHVEQVYRASFAEVLTRFNSIVAEFNSHFQHGQIRRSDTRIGAVYEIPGSSRMSILLFPRRETGTQVSGGELIGGAVMTLEGGASANLLLVRDNVEDLYGRWLGCKVSISGLVYPQKALSRLSSMPATVPFGFQNETDFYDHMVHAGGGMHIFTYDLEPEVDVLFRQLLETAFSQ